MTKSNFLTKMLAINDEFIELTLLLNSFPDINTEEERRYNDECMI